MVALSEIEVRDLPEQQTAVIRGRLAMGETSRIPQWLQQTMEAVQRSGREPAGMPFLRTFSFDEQGMDIEVGWPVAERFEGDGEVSASNLPGGPAAVVSYFGPYEEIQPAFDALEAWCREHGREASGPPWEEYFTSPGEEPDPAKWRTDVYLPLRG